jgi:hypothetical protein
VPTLVSTVLFPVNVTFARPTLPVLYGFKVRIGADSDPLHAIGCSLERRTGLRLINIKHEGDNQERGRIVTRDYTATLGVRTGNSYRIDRVVKFTIPAR